MSKKSAYRMTIEINYSTTYGEWVATIKEWPSCSFIAKTKEKAARGVLKFLKVGIKHGDMDVWAKK